MQNSRKLFYRQMAKRLLFEWVYLIEHPREAFNEIKWLAWPLTHIAVWIFSGFFIATIFFIYFCIYHRPRLIIKTPIRLRVKTLVVPNHLTLMDSVFLSVVLFYPLIIFRPSLIPVHLAAIENFFRPDLPKKWIQKWARRGKWLAIILERSFIERFLNNLLNALADTIMRFLRVYAIKEGRKGGFSLDRKIYIEIGRNLVMVFITNGRDLKFISVGQPSRKLSVGIGQWAERNKMEEIVVVYHQGIEEIENRRKNWINAGSRDLFVVVDRLDLLDVLGKGSKKSQREAIVNETLFAIQKLRREFQEGMFN